MTYLSYDKPTLQEKMSFELPFKFRRKSVSSDPPSSPPLTSSPTSPSSPISLSSTSYLTFPNPWDFTTNHTSKSFQRHPFTLKNFGSSFHGDQVPCLPSDLDASSSDFSEDTDPDFPHRLGLRDEETDTSGSDYFGPDSDEEEVNSSPDPGFTDRDTRGTFFTVSAERGRWKTDPRPFVPRVNTRKPAPFCEISKTGVPENRLEAQACTTTPPDPDYNTPPHEASSASSLPSSSPPLPSSPIQSSSPMSISPPLDCPLTSFSPVSPRSFNLPSPGNDSMHVHVYPEAIVADDMIVVLDEEEDYVLYPPALASSDEKSSCSTRDDSKTTLMVRPMVTNANFRPLTSNEEFRFQFRTTGHPAYRIIDVYHCCYV